MKNLDTISIDECRDELLLGTGTERRTRVEQEESPHNGDIEEECYTDLYRDNVLLYRNFANPIPNTLDEASKIDYSKYDVEVCSLGPDLWWCTFWPTGKKSTDSYMVQGTTEKEARFRLRVAIARRTNNVHRLETPTNL